MDGTAGEGCDGEAPGEGPVAGESEEFRRGARHFCLFKLISLFVYGVLSACILKLFSFLWYLWMGGIILCSFDRKFFGVCMESRKIIVFCRRIGFPWLGRVSGGQFWDSAKLHPLVASERREQHFRD